MIPLINPVHSSKTLFKLRSPRRVNVSFSISSFSSNVPKLTSSNSSDPPKVSLYQYAICPFCNINKALLSYANLPYSKIEVNPLTKAELKKEPFSKENDYKKVPIAFIDDEQYNGSSDINEKLLDNDFIANELRLKWSTDSDSNKMNAMSMKKFELSEESKQWTNYAKDELAPILYPNICRSLSESYHAFGYVNDAENTNNFTSMQKFWIRSIGSFAMYMAASRIKCKRCSLSVFVLFVSFFFLSSLFALNT